MLVTGATHGTMATASAAGGLAVFLVSLHHGDAANDDGAQREGDEDGSDIFCNPCKHSCQFLSIC